MASIYDKQLKNRNYLSPTGFVFALERCPKVSFFSNSVSLPEINLGVAEQPTYLKDIPRPGDKQEFGDFQLRFLIDEDLKNYMQIQNWMRGLGFPQSLMEIYVEYAKSAEVYKGQFDEGEELLYSDATLQVLNNNNIVNFDVVFKNLFPVNLSTISFDVTQNDNDFFTASATFKYMLYEVRNTNSQTKR